MLSLKEITKIYEKNTIKINIGKGLSTNKICPINNDFCGQQCPFFSISYFENDSYANIFCQYSGKYVQIGHICDNK